MKNRKIHARDPKPILIALAFLALSLISRSGMGQSPDPASSRRSDPARQGTGTRIWQESVTLPTYLVDAPDLNPRFYDGRAYQGAQGRVYPYPINESLSDDRVDKKYDMVYLENEYIKINVLPEIGGRMFGALDKTDSYDFIYRQHVIKPGLIGMLGAWISGGIEWNFPHHHRATAFMPVDYVLQENPDSSSTLWIGELEIRHRMKFMLGLTVYPGKSYVEITFRPFNRTPFANSFLYFANIGVHANTQYQVLFPPSTQYGTYHGKNQFIHWPVSHEVYNQVDYTEGVDVSWWKNHPEWTSIFCWNYVDDFVGGYDHGKDAGILCYSNHYIAPGKKFWTWSTGPRGKLWDAALTETDGPELEIMIGGYSDNQPDYSWLQPYESKYLKQYIYPIRGIRGIKNANLDAAVNLERVADNKVFLGFNTTSLRENARVVLLAGDQVVMEESILIDPSRPYVREIRIPKSTKDTDLKASLLSSDGRELVSYQPEELEEEPMPEVAVPPEPPSEIGTVEELYYTGLRLEQFHNPSFRPEPYYTEALDRDPGNYRVNTAFGLLCLRNAMYDQAEKYLQTAVDRITYNHTKPRDGEAYYYLGICQQLMGKTGEAYRNLYWATWSQAFHSAAYYHLARLDCSRGNLEKAMGHLDRSLSTNTGNTEARNLKSAILRNMGQADQALALSRGTMETDPLDVWSHFECYLANLAAGNTGEAEKALQTLRSKFRNYEQTWLELSLDYAGSGLWKDAIAVLSGTEAPARDFPMVDYFLGYYHLRDRDETGAMEYFRKAALDVPDYCFPFRLESIEVLETAIRMNPGDAKASYYLGNLLFEKQPEMAIRAWEKSRELDDSFSLVHRNLGWAYYKVEKDIPKATRSYERAVELNDRDQRLFYELDMVYAEGRVDPGKRLGLLEAHHAVLAQNNVADALAREVMLLVQLGRYNEALKIAGDNYFRQWEGVSKAYASYVDALLLRGMQQFKKGSYEGALRDFQSALEYPANMMVAEPYRGGRSAQVHYYIGTAFEALGQMDKAREHYRLSVEKRQYSGLSEIHYYRALSLAKLGRQKEADEIFSGLIELGKSRLDNPQQDFFAKFGERQSPADERAEAHYLMGLGYLGQSDLASAKAEFSRATEENLNHIWAAALLSDLKSKP